jgi:hypothetical protein
LQKLFLNVRQLPSVQDYKNGSWMLSGH